MTPISATSLAETPCGTQIKISHVAGEVRQRLQELGLRPGMVVHVQHKTHGGGRLLSFAGTRVAVSAASAAAIWGDQIR